MIEGFLFYRVDMRGNWSAINEGFHDAIVIYPRPASPPLTVRHETSIRTKQTSDSYLRVLVTGLNRPFMTR